VAKAPCSMKINLELSDSTKALLDTLADVGERLQIWSDVSDEIDRARAKHGVQHQLPMGTGPHASVLHELDQAAANADLYGDDEYTLDTLDNEDFERAAKELCQTAGLPGGAGDDWAKITLEEVAEAYAASEDDLDGELVQVIAMFVSMLQAHRRQQRERAEA
jgi:hypothetical protein